MTLSVDITPGYNGDMDLLIDGAATYGSPIDSPSTSSTTGWTAATDTTIGVGPSNAYLFVTYNRVGTSYGQVSRAVGTPGTGYVVEVLVQAVSGYPPVKVALIGGATTGAWTIPPVDAAPNTWTRLRLPFDAAGGSTTVALKLVPLYPYDTLTRVNLKAWKVYPLGQVSSAGQPGQYDLAITRTDANGVNVPVRVPVSDVNTLGTVNITDREAALAGTVSYTVTDWKDQVATDSDTAIALGPRLGTPATFTPTVGVSMVTGYNAARESQTTVHRVVGSPAPIAVLGVSMLRAGTLTVWAPDYATALQLDAMASSGQVVQLRQIDLPGFDMYFVPTRVNTEPDSQNPERWTVSLDYVEVERP